MCVLYAKSWQPVGNLLFCHRYGFVFHRYGFGVGNEMILIVKATSLVSTITIMDITGIARLVIAKTFSPVEIFIVAGLIYLTINFAVTRLVSYCEYKLTPHLRQ